MKHDLMEFCRKAHIDYDNIIELENGWGTSFKGRTRCMPFIIEEMQQVWLFKKRSSLYISWDIKNYERKVR